ncbi:MAG: hypothetical protein LBC20_14310 [Planctomycetaceae bacterium]|nr:hypothetical protein [Planctomycetaceae bacterium]
MDRQLVKNNFNTILCIILLIAISLFLGLLPTLSFGQDSFMSLSSVPSSDVPASSLSEIQSNSIPAPSIPATPAPIELTPVANPVNPVTDLPTSSPIPTSTIPPSPSSNPSLITPQQPHKTPHPMNVRGLGKSSPSGQRPPTQLLPNRSENFRSENFRSVADPNHPFARYFELPKESQSTIKGQPYTIAQLLDGTRTSGSRRQLLQTYWELTGLLAEYNIRCEAERLSGSIRDAQQNLATALLQQQRRSVEMEFVKKQWQLSGLLRYFKGISISEKELPIPCDYPLYKRYETFADKIAETARSQYLGHLIPVQEQLIDARHRGCMTLFEMLQNIPPDSRQLIDVLNQRTNAFLELIDTVIDYNKMIAEYASETIPSSVSGYRLVGALIELPKTNSQTPTTPLSNLQTPNSLTPNPLRSNLQVPDLLTSEVPVSNHQSTEYAEPLQLSETSPTNLQTEMPHSNLLPQRLPTRNMPFPPIKSSIVPVSHIEEQ